MNVIVAGEGKATWRDVTKADIRKLVTLLACAEALFDEVMEAEYLPHTAGPNRWVGRVEGVHQLWGWTPTLKVTGGSDDVHFSEDTLGDRDGWVLRRIFVP